MARVPTVGSRAAIPGYGVVGWIRPRLAPSTATPTQPTDPATRR